MAEPLKDRYNEVFFDGMIHVLQQVLPSLNSSELLGEIQGEGWEQLELKDRSRRIAHCLRKQLPDSWEKAATVLQSVVPHLHALHPGKEFEYIFLPEVVSEFGLEHADASCKALEALTQYTTSEFAIRPFIVKDLKGMMKRMERWSRHPHHGVRRWSSEGCRPLLPWGMVLRALKADPSPILPILNNLKADPSEFVRRSVANNLNDISKNHPDLVLDLTRQWLGQKSETDALLKHANRTLLKAGNPSAMQLFGFAPPEAFEVLQFDVQTPQVAWDGDLHFSFSVRNTENHPLLLRMEYAMDYLRANGTHNRKVFKISERDLEPGTLHMERKQSFRPITTRRYYPGKHAVTLVLNGVDVARQSFELLPA